VAVYYVKKDSKLYRFDGWPDLENFTGKSRKIYGNASLAEVCSKLFPKSRMAAQQGAFLQGWLDIKGNPVHSLERGNAWSNEVAL
jgi:hypothetical protein